MQMNARELPEREDCNRVGILRSFRDDGLTWVG